MPKIIENLEPRLILEARRQIEESGYGALTIRSVAKACGVGVGTVYNYFPSKDALVVTYMLSDWKQCLETIHAVSTGAQDPAPVARCIFDQLLDFSALHQNIFRDASAASIFAGSFSRYHSILRSQLALPLRKFCSSDFAAEFVAEALLTWTTVSKAFDEIYSMIQALF